MQITCTANTTNTEQYDQYDSYNLYNQYDQRRPIRPMRVGTIDWAKMTGLPLTLNIHTSVLQYMHRCTHHIRSPSKVRRKSDLHRHPSGEDTLRNVHVIPYTLYRVQTPQLQLQPRHVGILDIPIRPRTGQDSLARRCSHARTR
jgi:hypothetical protein